MRQKIKERILRQQKLSQNFVDLILSQKYMDQAEFKKLFFAYMCSKFSLETEEVTTDNFYEICQISAEKVAKMPHGELDAAESASKCGGATTAMNKKILFLLAVNREYQIQLDADDSIRIDTFLDLTDCVYQKLIEKRRQQDETESSEDCYVEKYAGN